MRIVFRSVSRANASSKSTRGAVIAEWSACEGSSCCSVFCLAAKVRLQYVNGVSKHYSTRSVLIIHGDRLSMHNVNSNSIILHCISIILPLPPPYIFFSPPPPTIPVCWGQPSVTAVVAPNRTVAVELKVTLACTVYYTVGTSSPTLAIVKGDGNTPTFMDPPM